MRFRSMLCYASMAAAAIVSLGAPLSAKPPDALPAAPPKAAATVGYTIPWYVASAGAAHLRNGCFRLNATIAQAAPGYSANDTYIVSAGYWAGAPTRGLDDIFFNGFQRCTP